MEYCLKCQRSRLFHYVRELFAFNKSAGDLSRTHVFECQGCKAEKYVNQGVWASSIEFFDAATQNQ